jgi:hypothetical protein
MNIYRIDVKYIFDGYCLVKADSAADAKTTLQRDFGGMLAGHIDSGTTDEDDVNWEFPIHPDVKMSRPRMVKKKKKVS